MDSKTEALLILKNALEKIDKLGFYVEETTMNYPVVIKYCRLLRKGEKKDE